MNLNDDSLSAFFQIRTIWVVELGKKFLPRSNFRESCEARRLKPRTRRLKPFGKCGLKTGAPVAEPDDLAGSDHSFVYSVFKALDSSQRIAIRFTSGLFDVVPSGHSGRG